MNQKRFINWSGEYECIPNYVHHPVSQEEVRDIVRRAMERGSQIRVFGSGHSPSDMAMSDEELVCLDGLNTIKDIHTENQTVVVEAGVTIDDLSQSLAKYGLALPNLGSISAQTISGAMATATHGTGLNYGIMPTIIEEITLVNGKGEIIKVSQVENSQLFKAVQCHLGSLGLITEYKLKVTKSFDLEVKEQPQTLAAVFENLPESLKSDHYRFWYLPHVDMAWEWTANRKSPEESTVKKKNIFQRLRDWYQQKLIGFYTFEFLLYLATFNQNLIPIINHWYAQQMFSQPKQSRGNSLNQFTFDCLFKQQVNEWAIPIEYTVQALEEIRDLIQKRDYKVHLPIEVRFVKGDDIWLSPCQGRDSCYIGIINYMPYGKKVDCRDYFNDYEKIMTKFDGRPHWAKRFGPDADKLAKLYPHWDDFQQVRYQLDPDNRFGNSYSERVLTINN
ncbi:MAG: D-arabinono-1,4-lactone oxidase [Cyanobacteria bacterium P01_D01_bin.116]